MQKRKRIKAVVSILCVFSVVISFFVPVRAATITKDIFEEISDVGIDVLDNDKLFLQQEITNNEYMILEYNTSLRQYVVFPKKLNIGVSYKVQFNTDYTNYSVISKSEYGGDTSDLQIVNSVITIPNNLYIYNGTSKYTNAIKYTLLTDTKGVAGMIDTQGNLLYGTIGGNDAYGVGYALPLSGNSPVYQKTDGYIYLTGSRGRSATNSVKFCASVTVSSDGQTIKAKSRIYSTSSGTTSDSVSAAYINSNYTNITTTAYSASSRLNTIMNYYSSYVNGKQLTYEIEDSKLNDAAYHIKRTMIYAGDDYVGSVYGYFKNIMIVGRDKYVKLLYESEGNIRSKTWVLDRTITITEDGSSTALDLGNVTLSKGDTKTAVTYDLSAAGIRGFNTDYSISLSCNSNSSITNKLTVNIDAASYSSYTKFDNYCSAYFSAALKAEICSTTGTYVFSGKGKINGVDMLLSLVVVVVDPKPTTSGGDINIDSVQVTRTGTAEQASVWSMSLKDYSVTTNKLATSAVTTAKIASSAVTSAKIGASAVTSDKLASNSVVTAKIADKSVTKPKLSQDLQNIITNAENFSGNIEDLKTTINNLVTQVNNNTSDISDLNTYIDDIWDEINIIWSRMPSIILPDIVIIKQKGKVSGSNEIGLTVTQSQQSITNMGSSFYYSGNGDKFSWYCNNPEDLREGIYNTMFTLNGNVIYVNIKVIAPPTNDGVVNVTF